MTWQHEIHGMLDEWFTARRLGRSYSHGQAWIRAYEYEIEETSASRCRSAPSVSSGDRHAAST